MSHVTNLILNIDILEEEGERIKEVNKYFEDSKGFVSVEDESLPHAWYGGTKMLETNLYIGAFNYLVLENFIDHLKNKVNWKTKDSQLIIKEQDNERFSIINFLD